MHKKENNRNDHFGVILGVCGGKVFSIFFRFLISISFGQNIIINFYSKKYRVFNGIYLNESLRLMSRSIITSKTESHDLKVSNLERPYRWLKLIAAIAIGV